MIDTHLHLVHFERSNVKQLINHLDGTGASRAVLLPLEGHDGRTITTEQVMEAVAEYPDRLIPFCSVDPTDPNSPSRLEHFAGLGCRGFGEQKVPVPIDHPGSLELYRLAGELGLPVLLHLEEGRYNTGFERFEEVVRRFPDTVFIGHAQTWWANIGKEPDGMYPKGEVKEGGISDRLLSEYENMYADLSAGSGLNALSRDKEFAAQFIRRHRNKLMWATDCPCLDGNGKGYKRGTCVGKESIVVLRELCAGDDELFDQLTQENAERLLKL